MYPLAACVLAIWCSGVEAQLPPDGAVIAHNGQVTSTPAGSGAVDVFLEYGTFFLGPIHLGYFEVATLEAEFAYPEASPSFLWARSLWFNGSGTFWTEVRIALRNADFAGWNYSSITQARSQDPVVDVGHNANDVNLLDLDQIGLDHRDPRTQFTLLGSEIIRSNDAGTGFRDSELIIRFDQPVAPGDQFDLHFNIIPSPGAAGATGFTASFTPVPEPATLSLMALGVLSAFACGRRAPVGLRRHRDLRP